jgi:choice-of-anchor C domain-containing protein
MMRRSLAAAALGVTAAIALGGAALAFTPTINGSFENGTYADNGAGFDTLPAASTALTGWTVGGSGIDWIGTLWTAADGTKSLDLNAAAPGSISQTFATTIGRTYVVTFALSGNPQGDLGAKTLNVSATGGPTTSYTFNTSTAANTVTNMKWTSQSYSFVATSASTTLTFTSTTAGAYGPALDNVAVTEKAGPNRAMMSACKHGGWKAMTDGHGHHFKNQGDCVSFYATGGRNLGSRTP